jgi:hypothetical protein
MKFRSTVVLNGKTATGLRIPDEVVAALGSGQRPAVRITIGCHTYRSTVAPMGGEFWLPLSAENRAAAGVRAGDDVEVGVELDTEPRVVTVPTDLAEALEQNDDARNEFARLSYSHQRRWVMSIEDAKTSETRQRRIGRAVEDLHAQAAPTTAQSK